MADQSRQHFIDCMKALSLSTTYSDLKITHGKHTHRAHKLVVCTASTILATASKTSQDGVIDISFDEPDIVKLLVDYIYSTDYAPELPSGPTLHATEPTWEYDPARNEAGTKYSYKFPHNCKPDCPTDYAMCPPHHRCGHQCDDNCKDFICSLCYPAVLDGDASQMLLHAKMYAIGDKYKVLGLQQLAREKFVRACVNFWDDKQFAVAARYAHASTPATVMGLRLLVYKVIAEHLDLMMKKKEIHEVMDEFNRLAKGVLICRVRGWSGQVKPTEDAL